MRHFKPYDFPKRIALAQAVLTLLTLGLMLAAIVPSSLAQAVGVQFDNARLERLRGLTFKEPVPIVSMHPAEYQHVVERDLGRDYNDERLQADGIAGSMLGLSPRSST
jgi:hypothetical protein